MSDRIRFGQEDNFRKKERERRKERLGCKIPMSRTLTSLKLFQKYIFCQINHFYNFWLSYFFFFFSFLISISIFSFFFFTFEIFWFFFSFLSFFYILGWLYFCRLGWVVYCRYPKLQVAFLLFWQKFDLENSVFVETASTTNL